MKNIIYCMLILLLPITACNKNNTASNNDTLTGKWKLVKYHNMANGTIEPEPTNISRSIIMEFNDNRVNGTMKGHTVTNSVSGEYELFQNQRMKTVSFGGTKVGEPNWGSKFWDAIHAASSFERRNKILFIFFNSDSEKMEFHKD